MGLKEFLSACGVHEPSSPPGNASGSPLVLPGGAGDGVHKPPGFAPTHEGSDPFLAGGVLGKH